MKNAFTNFGINYIYNVNQTHVTHNNESNISKYYFTIPYFGHQLEKLKKELHALLLKHFPDLIFNIIPVNKFSIGTFFCYKDKLPKSMRSSLMYKFSCARCASSYVGSTCRALFKRVVEHAGVSYRTGLHLSTPMTSSIRSHTERCDSSIDLNSFSILGTCSSESDFTFT